MTAKNIARPVDKLALGDTVRIDGRGYTVTGLGRSPLAGYLVLTLLDPVTRTRTTRQIPAGTKIAVTKPEAPEAPEAN